mgnify:CR=1 FL=1
MCERSGSVGAKQQTTVMLGDMAMRQGSDGGYDYDGKTAAAASAMASGERGREQGEE